MHAKEVSDAGEIVTADDAGADELVYWLRLLAAETHLNRRGKFDCIDARGVTGAGSARLGTLQFKSRCPILKLPI